MNSNRQMVDKLERNFGCLDLKISINAKSYMISASFCATPEIGEDGARMMSAEKEPS
jgi:hypothetical protein